MVQAAHAVDICFQQEVGESSCGLSPSLRVLQLLPRSLDYSLHSCNGVRLDGSQVGNGGIVGELNGHRGNIGGRKKRMETVPVAYCGGVAYDKRMAKQLSLFHVETDRPSFEDLGNENGGKYWYAGDFIGM